MARGDCAVLLASTGLPVVYWKWPDGSTPTYPCVRYSGNGESLFRADDAPYVKADKWTATLVSEWKDDASEALLESAFDAAGIAYTKYADYYAEPDGLNHVEYTFEMPR